MIRGLADHNSLVFSPACPEKIPLLSSAIIRVNLRRKVLIFISGDFGDHGNSGNLFADFPITQPSRAMPPQEFSPGRSPRLALAILTEPKPGTQRPQRGRMVAPRGRAG